MKLKQTIYLLTSLFLIFFTFSCNDNTDNYTTTDASADSQIYSFKLKATPVTKADSTNYPILEKTSFVIDQLRQIIYNPDSLPYNIHLKKFAATVTYSDATPSKLELIYHINNNDSVVSWNGTDSIDFSKKDISLKVIPANGVPASSSIYKIQLRVHQINPDSLVWHQVPSLGNAQTGSTVEKILLQEDAFYRFYLSGGAISFQTAKITDNSPIWSNTIATNLPNNVIVKNIISFNNKFYAVDETGETYGSSDGTTWDKISNGTFVKRMIGVIPEKDLSGKNDSLLIVLYNDGDYFLTRTQDLKTFGAKTKVENSTLYGSETFIKLLDFDFFAWTKYNYNNLNQNYLTFIGLDNSSKKMLSWLFASQDSKLIITKNSEIYNPFGNGIDLNNTHLFRYDNKFNALNNNQLFLSKDAVKNWYKAPKEQALNSGIKTNEIQSVVIDGNNYIWIFTNDASSHYSVWKGRLNRLIK